MRKYIPSARQFINQSLCYVKTRPTFVSVDGMTVDERLDYCSYSLNQTWPTTEWPPSWIWSNGCAWACFNAPHSLVLEVFWHDNRSWQDSMGPARLAFRQRVQYWSFCTDILHLLLSHNTGWEQHRGSIQGY